MGRWQEGREERKKEERGSEGERKEEERVREGEKRSFLKLSGHSDIQICRSFLLILLFNTQSQTQKAELDVKSQKPQGLVLSAKEQRVLDSNSDSNTSSLCDLEQAV